MTVSLKNKRKTHLRRWIIMLSSPVAWTISFGIIYLLNEAVCGLHFWRWFVQGEITAVIPVMLLILVLTMGITVGNIYLGWKVWRHAQPSEEDPAERDRFIGAAGLMMGSLFTFLTLGLAVVVVWLQPC